MSNEWNNSVKGDVLLPWKWGRKVSAGRVTELGYNGHTCFRRLKGTVTVMGNRVGKGLEVGKDIAWLKNNEETILSKS